MSFDVVTITDQDADTVMAIMKQRQREFRARPHQALIIPMGMKYGSTNEHELAYLGRLAWGCAGAFPDDHVILEIGSLVGKSTITMASVAHHKVVSVDPHDGPWEILLTDGNVQLDNRDRVGNTYDTFISNLIHFGVYDKVEVIQEYSDEAARNWDGRRICLLFIDGDHTEKWVRHDFDEFYEYVAPGGYIAFHDYSKSFNGVRIVVDEAIEQGLIRKLAVCGDLFVSQKEF